MKEYFNAGTIIISLLTILISIIEVFISTEISLIDLLYVRLTKKTRSKYENLFKKGGCRLKDFFELYTASLLIKILLIGKKGISRSIYKNNKQKERFAIDKSLHSNDKQNSIIDEIYNKKRKQSKLVLISVTVGIMIYCCKNLFFYNDIQTEVLFFLDVLLIFLLMSRFLISYRIERGYYGMNYEECKELIYYLMDDNDKNDKNKGKKIFNEIDDYNKVEEKNTEVDGKLLY